LKISQKRESEVISHLSRRLRSGEIVVAWRRMFSVVCAPNSERRSLRRRRSFKQNNFFFWFKNKQNNFVPKATKKTIFFVKPNV